MKLRSSVTQASLRRVTRSRTKLGVETLVPMSSEKSQLRSTRRIITPKIEVKQEVSGELSKDYSNQKEVVTSVSERCREIQSDNSVKVTPDVNLENREGTEMEFRCEGSCAPSFSQPSFLDKRTKEQEGLELAGIQRYYPFLKTEQDVYDFIDKL